MHHWLFLSGAILLEVAGKISMKLSEGFTRPMPAVVNFVFYIISFVALTFAIEKIEVSTAYTIWAGVGTALIAIIGLVYFGETATAIKFISIILIIIGVIGLSQDAFKFK